MLWRGIISLSTVHKNHSTSCSVGQNLTELHHNESLMGKKVTFVNLWARIAMDLELDELLHCSDDKCIN